MELNYEIDLYTYNKLLAHSEKTIRKLREEIKLTKILFLPTISLKTRQDIIKCSIEFNKGRYTSIK